MAVDAVRDSMYRKLHGYIGWLETPIDGTTLDRVGESLYVSGGRLHCSTSSAPMSDVARVVEDARNYIESSSMDGGEYITSHGDVRLKVRERYTAGWCKVRIKFGGSRRSTRLGWLASLFEEGPSREEVELY